MNAGSNDISVFALAGAVVPILVQKLSSGGEMPIGVSLHDDLLYVLNAGGAGNISGHTFSRHGALSPLAGSTRPLSGDGAGPAQVSFDPRRRDGSL